MQKLVKGEFNVGSERANEFVAHVALEPDGVKVLLACYAYEEAQRNQGVDLNEAHQRRRKTKAIGSCACT